MKWKDNRRPILTIAISTMEERIDRLNKKQLKKLNKNKDIEIIIIVQFKKNNRIIKKEEKWGKVYFFKERGLSRSRNRALEKARGHFILFGDDDVIYLERELDKCIKIIKENRFKADAFVFKMKKNKISDYYIYPEREKKLNRFNCGFVSSVTLCVNKDFIDEKRIKFDERFGIGGIWPSGEEFIFLIDLISAGGNVWFLPCAVAIHPSDTTSKKLSRKDYYRVRGAIFKRAYGPIISIFVSLAFLIKNRDFLYLKDILQGWLSYKGKGY